MFGGKTADNFSSLKDFSGRTRAFVKIQDGCDLFCSYCIVPYVRGSSKCRDLSEILDEIRRFVSVGYKEIVLTGVHIGNHEGLSTILKEAETIPELLRVRISSIEPQEMTEELLAIFSSLKKLCRHFHIPLQSGSDEVLKKMNRRYTYGEYKKIISRINCRLPDVTLTTDIIVGFPGETKEDFDKTCRAVNDIGFVKVHIFPYSRRLGTKAAGFSDQIAQLEIKRRAKVLQNIADGTAETIKKIFVGTTQEVLIESAGKKFNGYTKGYLPVRVNNKGSNEIVKVLITGLDGQYLLG
jgi:threonylcarbamoyladenosine tRNA methylthiotransferase MtaB